VAEGRRRCQRGLEGPQINVAFHLLELFWVDSDPSLPGPTANAMITTAVGETGGCDQSTRSLPKRTMQATPGTAKAICAGHGGRGVTL
jgi:hypothetical protein